MARRDETTPTFETDSGRLRTNADCTLDKPGRSAHTIEKFEHHARTCSYAIALFTADDRVIRKAVKNTGSLMASNVVFETETGSFVRWD